MEKNINDSILDAILTLKAIEEVDLENNTDLAIQVISAPDLDPKIISGVITCSLMGTVVYKTTRIPVKLNNKTIVAGMLNRMSQLDQ